MSPVWPHTLPSQTISPIVSYSVTDTQCVCVLVGRGGGGGGGGGQREGALVTEFSYQCVMSRYFKGWYGHGYQGDGS